MVCGQDNRCSQIAQFVEHIEDPLPTLRIDSYGRFIQQQYSRTMQDTAGDIDPSLHPSGKSSSEFMSSILKGNPSKSPIDPIAERATSQAMISSKTNQILAGRQVVVDR
jgi:hypothetical protein